MNLFWLIDKYTLTHCFIQQVHNYTEFSGTKNCYPPEYWTQGSYNGEQLDKWGAALVLYFISEGRIAFRNECEVVNKPVMFYNPNNSKMYHDLLSRLLTKDPAARLCYNVTQHPWFQN